MPQVMEEVNLTTIKPKNNVLLLAQEISFAKVLACNDKRLRDRGIKRLKKWFMARSQGSIEFTKDDFMRIWKGLFYCMWMSDKPLIQEELSEEISSLVHSFSSVKASLLFVETFFSSLSIEWFGIDQLRLDKFMMLVRRFIRQSLELVARGGWQADQVDQLASIYQRTLTSAPLGLSMHITEVFCEELAKVGKGELTSSTIIQFISVFARVLATLKDGRFISQITRCIFLHLIRQTDVGLEHQMKEAAWKEHGFPGGDVDTVEKVEMTSDSEEEEEMSAEDVSEEEDSEEDEDREVGVDARAGKVDVLLPPLDFDGRDLLNILRELRNKTDTTTKARKTLIQLIAKFEHLVAGKYPLGLHKVSLPDKNEKRKELKKATKRLYKAEQKLMYSCSSSDSEDEPEETTAVKRKRKNGNKQTKTVWEVSDSDMSGSHNGSGSNTSWKVSDATTEHKNPKKRKLEKRSDSETNNIQGSSFCVSESKENNSVPVSSTPVSKKSSGKKNVLKRASLNIQNQEMGSKTNELKKDNLNLKKKKRGKRNKAATTENTSPASESEKAQIQNENNENSQLQINASTTDKNNGWGGDWDQPLENGEYEIFIPNKKYVQKRKSLGLSYPVSSIRHKSEDTVTPVNKIKRLRTKSATPGSQKKVEFDLSANKSQDYKEYARSVKKRKSDVPFDASRKPVQGLLKNSTPSPINPFYKKKLKL